MAVSVYSQPLVVTFGGSGLVPFVTKRLVQASILLKHIRQFNPPGRCGTESDKLSLPLAIADDMLPLELYAASSASLHSGI
jgi:hypothetical protein